MIRYNLHYIHGSVQRICATRRKLLGAKNRRRQCAQNPSKFNFFHIFRKFDFFHIFHKFDFFSFFPWKFHQTIVSFAFIFTRYRIHIIWYLWLFIFFYLDDVHPSKISRIIIIRKAFTVHMFISYLCMYYKHKTSTFRPEKS